jgi:hypothetical protein
MMQAKRSEAKPSEVRDREPIFRRIGEKRVSEAS